MSLLECIQQVKKQNSKLLEKNEEQIKWCLEKYAVEAVELENCLIDNDYDINAFSEYMDYIKRMSEISSWPSLRDNKEVRTDFLKWHRLLGDIYDKN